MSFILIGNSRGIHIPTALIKQAGLEGCELEVTVVEGGLLLRPAKPVRQGWKAAFESMHAAGDDALLWE